jgi:hypothetical protein
MSPSSHCAKLRFQNMTDIQRIKVICSLLGILRVSEKFFLRQVSPHNKQEWKLRLQLSGY